MWRGIDCSMATASKTKEGRMGPTGLSLNIHRSWDMESVTLGNNSSLFHANYTSTTAQPEL